MLTWRARHLPVMSSRYEPPAASGPAGPEAAVPSGRGRAGRDTASLWESLSRGEDPTGPD